MRYSGFPGMPTFFMHTRDGDMLLEDHDGSVLADMDAAQQEAQSAAREMAATMIRRGQAIDGQCIEITGEDGAVHGIVRLRDVIKLV